MKQYGYYGACLVYGVLFSAGTVSAAARQSSAKAGETVEAQAVTAPVASMIPAVAQQQFDAAMRVLKAGQTDQASMALQQLSVAYPAFMGPLLNLGLIEQKADDHEAAVAWFKRALTVEANSPIANTHLGISYRHLGKFKDAEAAYQAAIAADASYAMAHLNLGILYDLYLQRAPQALQEYETYQGLLDTPDSKVASWIKELKVRVANAQPVKPAAEALP